MLFVDCIDVIVPNQRRTYRRDAMWLILLFGGRQKRKELLVSRKSDDVVDFQMPSYFYLSRGEFRGTRETRTNSLPKKSQINCRRQHFSNTAS